MSSSKVISSWSELMSWFDSYREKGWLFRGEIQEFDGLIPKIGRVSKKTGSPRKNPYTPQDEKRALLEFQKASRPYLTYEPRTEIEWLALGQHHGLPTRLLDWTQSLLVATFFAVEKAGRAGDAIIHCVKGIPEMDELNDANHVFDLKDVKSYKPPHISPRIPAQHSVFTIHPTPTDSFSHPNLETWTLKTSACWALKRSLNAAGINYASMNPGIDGLCQQIGWSYKRGFFDRSGTPKSRV